MKRLELLLMALHVPLDFAMLVLAAMAAYKLRFTDWALSLKPVLFDLGLGQFLDVVLPVVVGWLVIFVFSGLYRPDPNRKFGTDVLRIVAACTIGLAAVSLYVMFTQQLFDSRFLVVAGWGFAIMFVTFGRLFLRGIKALLYRQGLGLRRIVVIGQGDVAKKLVDTLEQRKGLGYEVYKQFARFNTVTRSFLDKHTIDEILLTNPRAQEAETLAAIRYANQHHVAIKYSADLFETYTSNMAVHPLAGVPVVELKPTPLEGWGRIVKRLFDIVFSLLVLVVLSPVLVLIALVVFLETGRPILYKNERVGVRGKHFFTLKFRSMYQEECTGAQFSESGKAAEKREAELVKKQNARQGPIYKIQDDPRVTPLGRFLRRWSLDELPQFFNVLKGEMSVVGPRPHQPREVEQYEDDYPVVFAIKPGITGLAQISGRSDLGFDEEMRLDTLYIETWSVWLDLIIVIKTPFILLRNRKAL